MKKKIIYLDCDGCWIDLYGVDNWLSYLINENPYPYEVAKPLVNLSTLARIIHKLQKNGIEVGIISWLSKNASDSYNNAVIKAKLNWFKNHIPSVNFNEIHIIPYGTPKSSCANFENEVYLFDDEERNRNEWINKGGIAFDEKNLLSILAEMA